MQNAESIRTSQTNSTPGGGTRPVRQLVPPYGWRSAQARAYPEDWRRRAAPKILPLLLPLPHTLSFSRVGYVVCGRRKDAPIASRSAVSSLRLGCAEDGSLNPAFIRRNSDYADSFVTGLHRERFAFGIRIQFLICSESNGRHIN